MSLRYRGQIFPRGKLRTGTKSVGINIGALNDFDIDGTTYSIWVERWNDMNWGLMSHRFNTNFGSVEDAITPDNDSAVRVADAVWQHFTVNSPEAYRIMVEPDANVIVNDPANLGIWMTVELPNEDFPWQRNTPADTLGQRHILHAEDSGNNHSGTDYSLLGIYSRNDHCIMFDYSRRAGPLFELKSGVTLSNTDNWIWVMLPQAYQ